ncbi:MAG TPA: hypothetical protein VJ063_17555, partial [Verrucomicrobiae bacterium]|nr:hypothetical protein [Verrucomicrobiae bacterium]
MIRIIAEIIESSDRERPADATMRRVLKARKSIDAATAREIAGAVFAYYRWFGWLNLHDAVAKQIRQAQELDRNPPADLRRASPEWVKDEVELTSEWLRSLQEKPRVWIRARRGQGAV